MFFAIHWHESAMDLHVFPIRIPPPTSLSIPSLWVFPVHQPWALVSYTQPGLVVYFTLDTIRVSVLFSQNIPPLKFVLYICVSFSVLSNLSNPNTHTHTHTYIPRRSVDEIEWTDMSLSSDWGRKQDTHHDSNNILLISSVTQLCLTLCDPMGYNMPGLPVHHQLPEFTQTHACSLGWWCHPTISSTVVPFFSCLQSFPVSGSFQQLNDKFCILFLINKKSFSNWFFPCDISSFVLKLGSDIQ